MRIRSTAVRKIFDSRGEPTIEVGVEGKRGFEWAAVPSGRSRGKAEAAVFPWERAAAALAAVAKKIKGRTFLSQAQFDGALLNLDGTPGKKRIGGNVALGLSVAFCRCRAAEEGRPAWRVLRDEFFPDVSREKVPAIYANLINGGKHASDNLALQEYLVIVKTGKSVAATVENLIALYRQLRDVLSQKRGTPPVGDEEGFQANFENSFEPVKLLQKLILKNRWQGNMTLGLDAAATSFWKGGKYDIDGKKRSPQELLGIYRHLAFRATLLTSIEDPFEENAWSDFAALQKAVPAVTVIGDDLTVTSAARIERAAHLKAISGVIIKPNQIGTVAETCAAVRAAQNHGMKVIVSHRSGETEDVFIVHLAKAAGADGLKIGAPAKERLLKYNEMMRVF